MFHTLAFYKSVDPAGADAALNAVQDPVMNTSGVYAYVPNKLDNLVAVASILDATVDHTSYVKSPSIADFGNLAVAPCNEGLTFEAQANINENFDSPLIVKDGEGLQFFVNTNPSSAVAHYGVIWLADAPLKKVTGEIFTVSGTLAATLSAGVWVNSNLTLTNALPVGNYDLVGMRVESPNGVAARAVIQGQSARPGVPCMIDENAFEHGLFRRGRCGVLGSFNSLNLPTFDVLGVTDTAQVVYLDLIAK